MLDLRSNKKVVPEAMVCTILTHMWSVETRFDATIRPQERPAESIFDAARKASRNYVGALACVGHTAS